MLDGWRGVKDRMVSLLRIFRQARIILPVLILAILVTVWGYSRLATRRTSSNAITVSGTIEAIEADISSKVAGRIVAVLVDEGDDVKKGQKIAVLDDEELVAQVEQTQGNLKTAQARLADLLAGAREEQIRQARANYQKALADAKGAGDVYSTTSESYSKSTELHGQLTAAEANYKAALYEWRAVAARLDLVRQGPTKEEKDRLRADLDQARAQLAKAEKDYKRNEMLYKRGAIAAQQFDAALAERDAQRAAVDAAGARYEEALRGFRSEEKREAEARLAQADAKVTGARKALETAIELYRDRLQSRQQMETARSSYRSANAQVQAAKAELDLLLAGYTKDAINAARGQVEQARGALAEAKSRLKDTSIIAPEDAVVTDKFRETGEFVTSGSPIVRIAQLERVWLRVYAPLPSLGKIKVNQRAVVTTDTYAGKHYEGRVSSISEEPEFTPKNVQTEEERVKLVYAIRIDLENRLRELKPGMPADAVISLVRKGDWPNERGSRHRRSPAEQGLRQLQSH